MKKILKKLTKLFIIMILAGCDFTSGVHKDILIAQEYLKTNQYDKTVQLYQRILDKKPSKQLELKIHFQLGQIYSIYLNDYSSSIKNYEKVIELTDDVLWQVKALESIGEINFDKRKNFNEANQIFIKLTEFRPKLKKHNYYLLKVAQSYFQLRDYNKASKLFKDLIKSKDNGIDTISYYYLGYINFIESNWNEAIRYWFENLKRETNSQSKVKIKFLIGNAYESAERLKEAYSIYYSIIGQYPNYEVIKSRLDSLYKRRVAKRR